MEKNTAKLEWNPEQHTLFCVGDWTIDQVSVIQTALKSLKKFDVDDITLSGEKLTALDSVGGLQVQQLISQLEQDHHLKLADFSKANQELFQVIAEHVKRAEKPPAKPSKGYFLYRVGVDTVEKTRQALDLLEFIGHVAMTLLRMMRHPHLFKGSLIAGVIEEAGFDALPIVGLLSFLIGIVLAYQMGVELRNYGADIFIVNVTGHAVLREFAPLITAIIAAGRTSSAYTAQIGTMKVTEEIDALETMGLSPIEWLVIPKMLGILVAIPLLTVWADFFGIIGSMVMAKMSLDIQYADYLTRFSDEVPLTTYMIGITKAPVFAAIIALTGCFQGFRVDYNARSVGKRTTISVVQAIFFLIVADSFFSIYLNWAGI